MVRWLSIQDCVLLLKMTHAEQFPTAWNCSSRESGIHFSYIHIIKNIKLYNFTGRLRDGLLVEREKWLLFQETWV